MYVLFGVIIVLVIVLLVMGNTILQTRRCGLQGIWTARTDFARDAEIDELILYIDEPQITISGFTCSAYILMWTEKTLCVSENIDLVFGPRTCTLDFQESDFIPNKLHWQHDIAAGTLCFYDDDRVWMDLAKAPQ